MDRLSVLNLQAHFQQFYHGNIYSKIPGFTVVG